LKGFNRSFGFEENGQISFGQCDGAENWQILSPIHPQPYGVDELNRWLQSTFRAKELDLARQREAIKLGDEEIVHRDKVIQIRNDDRTGFDWQDREQVEQYIANGEVGLVAQKGKSGFLNVCSLGGRGLRSATTSTISQSLELSSPYLIDRFARMPENMKLVIHDPALGHPLFQSLPEGLPHVHASRSNRTPLKSTQVLFEKLVQHFFRSRPNHSGSPVSRLLTTVKNFCFFPR
jgi:hypothetical protein